jgi:hypothetical protein
MSDVYVNFSQNVDPTTLSAWVSGHNYTTGQMVLGQAAGSYATFVYVCRGPHLSASTNAPGSGTAGLYSQSPGFWHRLQDGTNAKPFGSEAGAAAAVRAGANMHIRGTAILAEGVAGSISGQHFEINGTLH